MTNQLHRIGRRISWTLPAFVLATAGCGFPHDRYGSDPMLGAFLRPIAPTPPIWTGQDPGVSPAFDRGSRLGLPSPDVHSQTSSLLDRSMIVPTFNGNQVGGASERGSQSSNSTAPSPVARPTASATGAHLLQSPPPYVERATIAPVSNSTSSNSVSVRPLDSNTMLTSGAAIETSIPAPRPISAVAAMKDPRSVFSIEEGQAILQTCGAKSMVMEPQPTGEWRFICTMSDGSDLHRYESRSGEPIEAVRAVMWQVKNSQ